MWKLWKTSQDEGSVKALKAEVADLKAEITAIRVEWEKVQKQIKRAMGQATKSAALDAEPTSSATSPPDLDAQREAILRLYRARH